MIEKSFGWRKAGFITLFAVGLTFASVLEVTATHLRAGQITVERIFGRKVRVTVTVYTDIECTGPCVLFGGELDVLDFGDGSSVLVPETEADPLTGVQGVGKAKFEIDHTYPGNSSYIISYKEPNRNGGVLNMDNSIGTTFYLETKIDLSVLGTSKSPVFGIDPIDVGCVGVAFMHNPGAYDPDEIDSLSYELVVPFKDRATPVVNYRDPNNADFYTGVDYSHANEDATGPPTFGINAVDGTLTWDSPGKVGEYNIAFIVREWRKISGTWVAIGFVRRDMQIIVEDCHNERPTLDIPKDICAVAGTVIRDTIRGYDLVENNPVKIEAFSEIFNLDESPATYSPVPGPFDFRNPTAETYFTWNTICGHVKDQEYQVVFKITDKPNLGPKLATFETWRIKIVAPAPVLLSATTNLATRFVTLEWEPYECNEDASMMQIWRRVSSSTFVPDSCQTGMPESLGFTLIATRPLKDDLGQPVTSYTDRNNGRGLDANAQYCYRLVAIYPLPKGGESYVSMEKCIDPIITSEPVITKVSVEETDKLNGQIRIEWTPPLDSSSFPPPYQFQLQRLSTSGFISVSPIMDDTVFTDTGLNTYDNRYFYQVLLYSIPTPTPVDTSSIASTVWLDLNPQKNKIKLTWNAIVPWSNQLEAYPIHEIYRGLAGGDQSDMVLIELVNVLQEGLTYLDTGKLAPGDTLNNTLEYCYRVKTRGGYGNPKIGEPLENFSQVNCAMPTDDEPPCSPSIHAFLDACDDFTNDYGCDATLFTNTIRWSVPEGACKEDIRSYNLYEYGYSAPIKTGILDTFYLDTELQSLKRCYQVTSVDRSNNESVKSNKICNDNCPYYELPNIFSPNGDKCNDVFRAFGDDLAQGENPQCPEIDVDNRRCARFVQKVDFSVYNRWGRKVYSYIGQQGDEDRTIYIRWDGRDEKGRELAVGVYFYAAEVTFDVINSADRVKIIKGWVHLVR